MEFIVSENPTLVGSLWSVIGRCSSTVVRGERFTQCIPFDATLNDANEAVTIYGEPRPVELTVEKIIAYSHELDTLDSGMTARLLVAGDASSVVKRTVLRD